MTKIKFMALLKIIAKLGLTEHQTTNKNIKTIKYMENQYNFKFTVLKNIIKIYRPYTR